MQVFGGAPPSKKKKKNQILGSSFTEMCGRAAGRPGPFGGKNFFSFDLEIFFFGGTLLGGARDALRFGARVKGKGNGLLFVVKREENRCWSSQGPGWRWLKGPGYWQMCEKGPAHRQKKKPSLLAQDESSARNQANFCLVFCGP